MLKTEIQLVANQLNVLAEVFDKKAVTPKAIEVWFDTLRVFKTEQVMSILLAWPKTHHKFPAPAEVWKIANDFAIEDRAATQRADAAVRSAEISSIGTTQYGKKILAEGKRLLREPTISSEQQWRRVLQNPAACYLAKKYAHEVLNRAKERQVERQPGQDDEERTT